MPNLGKKTAKSSNSKSSASAKMNMNQLGLAVIVICVLVAVFFAYQALKNSNNSNSSTVTSMNKSATSNDSGQTAANAVASLSVNPSRASVSQGSEFKVQVWVDSKSDQVNAVQANLTYPADRFDFVKIDASGSAFGVAAPSHGGNGSVTITRGTIHPVTGKQLLATVVLKPTASSGTANIEFAKSSAVDRSTDNKNTLQNTYGGTYTLTP